MTDDSTFGATIALSLALLLVFAAFTPFVAVAERTGGGTVANAPSSAGVVVPETTIDGSTDSSIEIGYNATTYVDSGTVSQSDLGLMVRWAGGMDVVNLGTSEGTTSVTLPAGALAGGEHALTAYLINQTSDAVIGSPPLYESAGVVAATNVSVTDSSVSKTTVNVSEQFFVNATVENTGPAAESFTVAAYTGTNRSLAYTTVTVNASETKDVSLPVTVDYDTTLQVRVNGRSAETVTVGSGGGGGGGGGGGSSVVVDSASLVSPEVLVSDGFSAKVVLNNTGASDASKKISIDAYGNVNFTSQASNSSTFTVPAGQTRTVYLNLSVPSADKYTVSLPGGTSVTGWALVPGTHVVLANVGANITAIVNESTFLAATAYNLGQTNGTENQTVVWNGTVLASWNETVNSTERKDAFFQVTFPEKVRGGTVQIGGRTPNLTVRDPVVTASTVTCVSGPCPGGDVVADLGLDANMLQGDLKMKDGRDIDVAGATNRTRFRLNLTVQNFSAPILIGTGHDVTWERTTINGTHTRYVVEITASEWDYLQGAQLNSWPSGPADTASYHRNATVSLSFDPMDQYSASPARKQKMDGTIISTDAQTFGSPEFYPGGPGQDPRLELLVAGPHYQPDGTTVNDGYYEAFLPDSLLSAWNVSDGSTLAAAYQGSNRSLTTRNVSGGIYVDIPIHYSSGTVKVSPSANAGVANGGSNNGGSSPSGSSNDSPSTGDDDDDDAPTPTSTPTATPEPADTATPTATPSPTPTATPSPTEVTLSATPTPTDASTPADAPVEEVSATTTPGFTGALTLLALFGAALLALRRE